MTKEIQSREWLMFRLKLGIEALPNVAPEERKDCAVDLCRDLMSWAWHDDDVAHQKEVDAEILGLDEWLEQDNLQ
jgi:hypothetical protein